ncbi:hypothetical protein MKZ38_007692 [Zalerion maritima]|uniref:NADH dehydrogenase [ubiquinone] 1 alpha subcomplex assembly factor 3 n=1 Tax=Zalerion maritima TaxID=339359 RepID=A0AAD5RIJ3_9PEZI|nr:hypothetical protein MKZ38_007692 [Zalerion maritima]
MHYGFPAVVPVRQRKEHQRPSRPPHPAPPPPKSRGVPGEANQSIEGRQPKPESDLGSLDVLGDVPPPATSVDMCFYDGFKLNSGAVVSGGDGVILYGGEAFRWRPWVARDGAALRLLNSKGQWDTANEAFQMFEGLWPRPDMLIIGTGRQIRPVAPDLRKYISSLGIRVDVVDTRNAASQYNMMATERGELEVAAALIPMGWQEGVGAK